MKVDKIEIKETDGRRSVWLTGKENGWNTSQAFCDLYEVSSVVVAISPFNHRPMFVVKDEEAVMRMVRTMTGAR